LGGGHGCVGGGGARAITYDRRGWGDSSAPGDYRRTTVEEQSEDAAALIEDVADAPAVACGAGIGAVMALDLLLRRADLVAAAVLIEPPLLQLIPIATEALSQDRRRLEIAAGAGEDVIELYLSGALSGSRARRRPDSRRHGGGGSGAPGERVRPSWASRAGWRMPLPRPREGSEPVGDRHIRVDAASDPGCLGRACRSAGSLLGTGGRFGRGIASARGGGRGRNDRAGAHSVGGRRSASTSITPPWRATTAPVSSRTAMIAVWDGGQQP